ncbi:hypothetical protein [Streptomyces sp. NPDC003717]|uniref:hypothetical protein n=1 Tax=Streptomyces sp. NPDC003717 TaxID=3154276 RepID=UPI0033B48179
MTSSLPVPPPFMWTCSTCRSLLDDLAAGFDYTRADPLFDGAVNCQIALAEHIAAEHAASVPTPHTDGCPLCEAYERDDDCAREPYWAAPSSPTATTQVHERPPAQRARGP